MMVSYRGHVIPKSCSCSLTKLPGSLHPFHLISLALMNLHACFMPSTTFSFQQVWAHAGTQFVAKKCSTSLSCTSKCTAKKRLSLSFCASASCVRTCSLTLGVGAGAWARHVLAGTTLPHRCLLGACTHVCLLNSSICSIASIRCSTFFC